MWYKNVLQKFYILHVSTSETEINEVLAAIKSSTTLAKLLDSGNMWNKKSIGSF